MIVYPFDQAVIWHVCFHDEPRWWGKRSHVHLAGYADGTWLHLDLQKKGFCAGMIYAHDDVGRYLDFLLENYAVLRFGPCRGRSAAYLGPMTCVGFVKHVLGVRSGALRPWGLSRDLVRVYGAEWLNDPESSRSHTGAAAADGSGSDPEPAGNANRPG